MSDHYNWVGAWPNYVGVPPDGPPKTLGLNGMTFSVANVKTFLDLKDELQRGSIDFVQAVYIDNDTDAFITLQVEQGSRYRIIAGAHTQGWYPLIMHEVATISLSASTPVVAPNFLALLFSNVSINFGPYTTGKAV